VHLPSVVTPEDEARLAAMVAALPVARPAKKKKAPRARRFWWTE